MKIVITGPAGSGKTTVLGMLMNALGSTFAFASVDAMVRNIWERPDVLLWPDEYSRFKALVDGKDKDKVREQVFTDPNFRKELEDVMARAVNSEIHEFLDKYEHSVLEFPLLYERYNEQLYTRFDHVISLQITVDTQFEQDRRLIARGWTKAMIKGIKTAQLDNRARVTFVKKLQTDGVKVPTSVIYSDNLNMTRDQVRFIANDLKPVTGEKLGAVAGSFNPITKGHEHVIEKAAELLDGVIVAIGDHPTKKYDMNSHHRKMLVLAGVESLPTELRARVKVEVMTANTMLVSWAHSRGVRYVIRGIRGATDLEYESQLNLLNAKIEPAVSMLYVFPPRELTEVSSSLVRGCMHLKERDRVLGSYLSPQVVERLELLRKEGV